MHCLSAACWKQNILLPFSDFPSSAKVLLNFQDFRLASSSESPYTDIFPVLLPHVFSLICSFTTSFASSVITFLNLSQNTLSISLITRKITISCCTFPTSTTVHSPCLDSAYI